MTLSQNNFCGMGVTQNGVKGNSFATPQLGIRAQIQHLKAYASTEPLKQDCIDTRFRYVQRGCAPYVEWLGIQENQVPRKNQKTRKIKNLKITQIQKARETFKNPPPL